MQQVTTVATIECPPSKVSDLPAGTWFRCTRSDGGGGRIGSILVRRPVDPNQPLVTKACDVVTGESWHFDEEETADWVYTQVDIELDFPGRDRT